MSNSQKSRILCVMAAMIMLLSTMVPVVSATGSVTVFEMDFDLSDVDMTKIDSTTSTGESYLIAQTWYDRAAYKDDIRLRVHNNSGGQLDDSSVGYQVVSKPLGKGSNALEISGYNAGTTVDTIGNKMYFTSGLAYANPNYDNNNSMPDCGADGSFRISFDFATTNKNVQFAMVTGRTLAASTATGAGEVSTQFGKDLFILNSDGGITIFGDKIPAAQVGTINENQWNHIELTFNAANQCGVKLNGRVIRDMTTLGKAEGYDGSLRGLFDTFSIPVNLGSTDDPTASSSKRYLDNFKYEILDTLVTKLTDSTSISVTEGDVVLRKNCEELNVDRTKTVGELKAAISGTVDGNTLTVQVTDNDGAVMEDSALLTNAATCNLSYDGITYKSFTIIDAYRTVCSLTEGAPSSFAYAAESWQKNEISEDSCVTTENGIGGKAATDPFMKFQAKTANSSATPALNYWIVGDGFTTTAPITIETSVYVPKLSENDDSTSFYIQLLGKDSDDATAMEHLLKFIPGRGMQARLRY